MLYRDYNAITVQEMNGLEMVGLRRLDNKKHLVSS